MEPELRIQLETQNKSKELRLFLYFVVSRIFNNNNNNNKACLLNCMQRKTITLKSVALRKGHLQEIKQTSFHNIDRLEQFWSDIFTH